MMWLDEDQTIGNGYSQSHVLFTTPTFPNPAPQLTSTWGVLGKKKSMPRPHLRKIKSECLRVGSKNQYFLELPGRFDVLSITSALI